MLPRVHLIVGLAALAAFLLTGQYMAWVLKVSELGDLPRMLYRSSHIYLFFAAAINVFLGLYYRPGEQPGIGSWANSLLILAAPLLLLYSFIVEPALGGIERTTGKLGVILVFVGLLNACIVSGWRAYSGRRKIVG